MNLDLSITQLLLLFYLISCPSSFKAIFPFLEKQCQGQVIRTYLIEKKCKKTSCICAFRYRLMTKENSNILQVSECKPFGEHGPFLL